MTDRARFTAELEGEDLIVVVDLNGGKSVTKDAERVVATIADYVTIGDRQIVYRNGDRRWDGMLVRDGRAFGGFVRIGAKQRDEAIDAMRHLLRTGFRKGGP